MKGTFKVITPETAKNFLLPRHYSGRAPVISVAFGWYFQGELKAVCTFGKPASRTLCTGICGEENQRHVYELNRLCREPDLKEPLSQFVAACLRRLRAEDWIIVSYSDRAMHHNGYIYQATNFLYTGATKERTDKYIAPGKHHRHDEKNVSTEYRVLRSSKNRYVYFCTFRKDLKNKWLKELRYPILPYPKEKNENYILGNYQKEILIRINKKQELAEPEELG